MIPIWNSAESFRRLTGATAPAEAALLLSCASIGESPMLADTRRALNSNLDWERVLRLARANGMIPLLYGSLHSACADQVPEPVLRDLRISFHANAMRNRMMARELARILALLAENDILALTFKGPVLALLAYGDVGMRQIADLDIVVRPADVGRAGAALSAEGYIQRTSQPALHAGFFQVFEDSFEHPACAAPLDLHWRLTPRYFPFAPDFESLWPRSTRFMLDGYSAPTLSASDLMLFLCVHSSKHGWPVLSNVADVAFLTRADSRLDWTRVHEEAARLKCRRMLLLGAYLAGDVLGAPVSPDLLSHARRDKAVKRLAGRILRNMFTLPRASDERGLAGWSVPLRLIDSFSQRLIYTLDRALAPTIEDWEFVNLPKSLFPLYYPLRPGRLALRSAARLIGRTRSSES